MKRTKQVNIAPPRLFSCILRALLFALCAQISWACTLNTPDQITNGVPFQVSFTACTVGPTDPGTFQLWDQDTNTLLVSDLVIGSPFSVTIETSSTTVYFVLIDASGSQATSKSYTLNPSPGGSSLPGSPSSTPVTSTTSVYSISSLSLQSLLSLSSIASVSSVSVNSRTTTTSGVTTTTTTSTHLVPSSTSASSFTSSNITRSITSQPTAPGSSTFTSASSSSTPPPPGGSSPSAGLVAGAAIGGIVALVVVTAFIFWLVRKFRPNPQPSPESEPTPPPYEKGGSAAAADGTDQPAGYEEEQHRRSGSVSIDDAAQGSNRRFSV